MCILELQKVAVRPSNGAVEKKCHHPKRIRRVKENYHVVHSQKKWMPSRQLPDNARCTSPLSMKHFRLSVTGHYGRFQEEHLLLYPNHWGRRPYKNKHSKEENPREVLLKNMEQMK